MSKKDEYVVKMKKQLDAWSTDIDQLQVKAAADDSWEKLKGESERVWGAPAPRPPEESLTYHANEEVMKCQTRERRKN